MPTENSTDGFTTLPVRKSQKRRLEDLKPYDSLSWGEFVGVLADNYEKHGGDS